MLLQMRFTARPLLAMIVVWLAGCDQQAIVEKFAAPEDQAFAKSQIQLLRARDFEPIEKAMDRNLVGPQLRDTFSQMADLIPEAEPESITLVGAQWSQMANQTTTNITYEYSYPNKWLLINVATRKTSTGVKIIGFRVQPLDRSLEEQARFTLSGRSALQYIVLALALVVPLFTLYALAACIRTRLRRRKWLWILFILCGVGKLAVNWSTGEWFLSLLSVQLLGAGAFATPFSPWVISVSFPLGAILFLLKRKQLRVSTEEESVSSDESATDEATEVG